MTARVKNVALILAAQTLCTALGLWMHYAFTASSARRALVKDAWTELAESAAILSDSMRRQLPEATGAPSPNAIAQAVNSAIDTSDRDAAIVTDERFAPVWWTGFGADDHDASADRTVAWRPRDATESLNDQPVPGLLSWRGEDQVAVACSLASQHLVVFEHRPRKQVIAAAAPLLSSLPSVGALTLVWIVVPLGMVLYLLVGRFHDRLESERSQSAAEAMARSRDLVRTRDAVIFGLAKLAESRDPETGDHLERISIYATMLASALQHHRTYRRDVTPQFLRLIGISSALHDIGKVGIEDSILLKSDALSAKERLQMEVHTVIGGQCLREIEHRLGTSNFLQMAREIALSHHEHWDGSGYPYGLSGTDIPLAARVVAIVDVYDALMSRRVYKSPWPHRECVETIERESGRKFDPELVKVWVSLELKFEQIARRYQTLGHGQVPSDPIMNPPVSALETAEPAIATAGVL